MIRLAFNVILAKVYSQSTGQLLGVLIAPNKIIISLKCIQLLDVGVGGGW